MTNRFVGETLMCSAGGTVYNGGAIASRNGLIEELEHKVEQQASQLEAFEQHAIDVYTNYHPDYYQKLPVCVQVLWKIGEAALKQQGREVIRHRSRAKL